jgi:nitrogen fixation/metabolism regulation signal transduction histidine kinase
MIPIIIVSLVSAVFVIWGITMYWKANTPEGIDGGKVVSAILLIATAFSLWGTVIIGAVGNIVAPVIDALPKG